MCNLSQGVLQKGIAKGRIEGHAEGRADERTENIRNLVKNMGVSIERAMSVLEVPEDERQKYKDLLEHEAPKE